MQPIFENSGNISCFADQDALQFARPPKQYRYDPSTFPAAHLEKKDEKRGKKCTTFFQHSRKNATEPARPRLTKKV